LAAPARMTAMRAAAQKLGRPGAAEAIAAQVLAELEQRHAQRPAAVLRAPAPAWATAAEMAAKGWH